MRSISPDAKIAWYADMLAAMGAETRLRIMRLLLSSHPAGLVVGAIQKELGLTPSNLSHHLEILKHRGLVTVRRDGVFHWYSANTTALQRLLQFLYAECCGRNRILSVNTVIHSKN